MNKEWLNKWNSRYEEKEYAYGEEPNVYLREQLSSLDKGRILFAAEGEGRNAVYAAKLGWDTIAFDISIEGKKKADALAKKHGVAVNYIIGELPELGFQEESFDTIALIYAHFPPPIRSIYHQILGSLLKKDGRIILEAFGPNHLPYRAKNPAVGGPNNLGSLISLEEVKKDFPNYEIITLTEEVVSLDEGLYHKGEGSVTRFVGIKK